MPNRTTSEKVFEDYLGRHGLRFERIAQGNLRTPDYRIRAKGEDVIVEVKEFARSQKRRGGYCPVPFVSRKISASWGQLERFQDYSCCVVLYNESSTTLLLEPELVLCAMFGEYFERMDMSSYQFSGTAAVGSGRNTRVSAVIAMLPLRIQRDCVEAARRVFQLTGAFGRELSADEVLQIHRETSCFSGEVESVVRAVAIENPFARRQLPPSVFDGPFDEKWARVENGSFRRIFSGARVAELRSLLPEYATKMMGLW